MGHKHSTLHSQLKNRTDGPNCDLVMSPCSATSAEQPYVKIKNGPFKRKLSMRNISIRRSFHMGGKHNRKHKPLNEDVNYMSTASSLTNSKIGTSATTDHIPTTSSSSTTTTANNQYANAPSTSKHINNHNSCNNNTNNTNINNDYNQATVLPRTFGRQNKMVMDRLGKSFRNSFRKISKKSDIVTESQRPHQWQSDEHAVRSGNCIFSVKYLGCVEVFDSRGMQICEDALRRLRNSRRRGIKGQLYVTGDGIRVVDDDTKGLIVDQTIEKVSFCAPDRNHERGFSYICRDGTTRRWMCHGFHATKDSGERLSHAVGCAFIICLERKQKRDKESVSAIMNENNFHRTSSFRQSTITERLQDPQVAKPAEPVPVKPVHNPYAVARPHATASLLQRQGSLRGGPLNHASPFKRQLSLRLNSGDSLAGIDPLIRTIETSSLTPSPTKTQNDIDLIPTTRNRAQSLDLAAFEDCPTVSSKTTSDENYTNLTQKNVTLKPSVTPIQEVSPTVEKKQQNLMSGNLCDNTNNEGSGSAMIAALCQQLSQGLSILSAKTDLDSTNTNTDKTSIETKTSNGTDLLQLNEGTNSFFTSNIDDWMSNTKPEKIATSNISQQLNPGSLDSGIASGSSLQGATASAATNIPLIPPPVVDQMPQVTAPPPPSSPSLVTSINTTTTTTVSSTKTASNKNDHHNPNNPFLSNDEDWKLISETKQQNVPAFKSTNPFLDLSPVVTISKDVSINTATVSSASSNQQQQQQMVKAFEVSM